MNLRTYDKLGSLCGSTKSPTSIINDKRRRICTRTLDTEVLSYAIRYHALRRVQVRALIVRGRTSSCPSPPRWSSSLQHRYPRRSGTSTGTACYGDCSRRAGRRESCRQRILPFRPRPRSGQAVIEGARMEWIRFRGERALIAVGVLSDEDRPGAGRMADTWVRPAGRVAWSTWSTRVRTDPWTPCVLAG